MNWVNAYLTAIKAHLPLGKRDDIAAELEPLLEESLEAETGKTVAELSEAEVLSWLKTREHPLLVANRYQDRRTLVDEDSFPLFKLTLRYALIGLAVAYTLLAILTGFLSDTVNLVYTAKGLIGNIVDSGLKAFAVITLVFYFFGRNFNARERLANWNPKDLPDPREKWEQESYASSIAGLIFTGIFLLFINGFLSGVYYGILSQKVPVFQAKLVEEAVGLLPWINAVVIMSILLHAVMILKPRWSVTTLSIHGLIAVASAIIVIQLQGVTPLFRIVSESAAIVRDLDQVVWIINTSARWGLIAIAAGNIFEALRDIRRIFHLIRRDQQA